MYNSPPITGVVQELFCHTTQHPSLHHKDLLGQKGPVNFTLRKIVITVQKNHAENPILH